MLPTRDRDATDKIALRLHTTERSLIKVINENSPINYSWEELPEAWQIHYKTMAGWFLLDIEELGYHK